MYKAKAMRSSWEFVVVGLNFFFCFSPTTSASAADPSGWRDGLDDCSYLGRVGTCGHAYRNCHYAVCEALFTLYSEIGPALPSCYSKGTFLFSFHGVLRPSS